MNKLFIILLTLSFLLPTMMKGQGWEKIYTSGSVLNEAVTNSATKTPDGNLLVLSVQTENSVSGLAEPILYKIDTLGNLLWEYHDITHADSVVYPQDVIVTSDGNYLMSFYQPGSGIPSIGFLQKITPDGTVLWVKNWETGNREGVIQETSIGDLIILGTAGSNSNEITKLDNAGNFIWSQTMFSGFSIDMLVTENDDVLYTTIQNFGSTTVYRLDGNDGTIIWEKEYEETNPDIQVFSRSLLELSNGEIVVGITSFPISASSHCYPTLLKIDSDGNEIWRKSYFPSSNNDLMRIEKTQDDEIIMFGHNRIANNLGMDANLFSAKLDADGNMLWERTYGTANYETAADVIIADDNGLFMVAQTFSGGGFSDIYVAKTDSLGISFTNQLSGNFYEDENVDCIYDTAEEGLSQWHIEAEKEDFKYHAVTDSLGNYEFLNLDTGTYQITAYPISPYWEVCNDSFTVDFTSFFDTLTKSIGGQVLVECPLLDVSIGTPFLRRCFENTYTVNYCNYGTSLAESAFVEVDFDSAMIILNTSIPTASQNGNFLTFDLGDVPAGDCGSFTVDVLLGEPASCDSIPLGATHCVAAHIYPDSICLPNNNWSGASIEVDALCVGDSIHFEIRNVGGAASDPNLQYWIIEDDVILYFNGFGLNPGEVLPVSILATGATYRLEADQEPNHPGMSMPSVGVEGCNINLTNPHLGFINIFNQDDGDPFVDIDCRVNIGSYDPNDKQGFPLGYGSEYFIDMGQEIEYLIRFQNTGTDTAFNIMVEDKLSDFLDINSVRPGASSHPYQFSISHSRMLQFKFDNIMLPDSNANQYASNGFVKFKVAQMPNLELGTQIRNSAGIYFDFNPPIVTNRTRHTIGENYIAISTSVDDPFEDGTPKVGVKIYPNPFSIETKIELQGVKVDEGIFKLYDATGRLIRAQNFNGNQFVFSKKDLRTGMYFFTIENNNQIVSTGKLMAQQH